MSTRKAHQGKSYAANPYLRMFLAGMLVHAAMAETTFESERVLVADTTVDVADGDVLKIGVLSGNYILTKTGGGELVVYSVAQPSSGGTSISLEGGSLSFALCDRPAAAMS